MTQSFIDKLQARSTDSKTYANEKKLKISHRKITKYAKEPGTKHRFASYSSPIRARVKQMMRRENLMSPLTTNRQGLAFFFLQHCELYRTKPAVIVTVMLV